MKKITLCILSILTVLTFSGCGKEEVKLDLKKVYDDLSTLTKNEMDIQYVDVDSMNEFSSELEFIYSFDFEDKLRLDSSLIDENEYKVYYNADNKEIIAILKPLEGKKEEVKSQLSKLMKELNAKEEEINGYLVYVASSDNDSVLSKIRNSKPLVFAMVEEASSEDIEMVLNLKTTDYDEILMGVASVLVKSNTYIIVKPAEGREETVTTALNTYMTALENQWANYLPDQYELVKNRKEVKIGDYLVYIISEDNELVYQTILNNKIAE